MNLNTAILIEKSRISSIAILTVEQYFPNMCILWINIVKISFHQFVLFSMLDSTTHSCYPMSATYSVDFDNTFSKRNCKNYLQHPDNPDNNESGQWHSLYTPDIGMNVLNLTGHGYDISHSIQLNKRPISACELLPVGGRPKWPYCNEPGRALDII